MEQRDLGRTGLRVSALGFGCGTIGGLFVRGDRSEQTRAVMRALEAGVTYFDTAPSYGDGHSEENLGRVLRELDAWDRIVLGTKVRLRTAELREPADAVLRSCEQSLRRLRRDAVDVLQLHNPIIHNGGPASFETPSGSAVELDAVQGGIAEGMRQVIRRGLARHAGMTGLGDTLALDRVVATRQFATIQTYFNALNPSAGFAGATGGSHDFDGLIDAAADAGMGVIAIRVMAAGALSVRPERHSNAGDPGGPLVPGSAYTRDLERARAMQSLALELGLDGPLELALRFALAKAGVSTVLVGYSDLAQLNDALRWTERGPLPRDAISRIVELAR